MSTTGKGRILDVEFFGTIHCGQYGYAFCRIERVDNQGLPERYLVVEFTRDCTAHRDRIPDGMSNPAAIDAIRNPRTDKWPCWGRALEQSRAEGLENGRESEMTRSYSSGRSHSR
jgi:hypothetical protein